MNERLDYYDQYICYRFDRGAKLVEVHGKLKFNPKDEVDVPGELVSKVRCIVEICSRVVTSF